MPCDPGFEPRQHWYARLMGEALGPPRSLLHPQYPRARPVADWPRQAPRPWLVDVGGGRDATAAWFVAGVTEWLEAAAQTIADERVTQRARPLLALPLVGTGLGGAAARAGDVVRALLPVLYDGAERHGVDIALVTHEGPAHAAALESRRKLDEPRKWPAALGTELRERATRLAGEARRGNLVLFLGAGLPMGAGLPGWDDMLSELAREVGIGRGDSESDGRQLAEFGALAPLDRARLIARRHAQAGGRTIGEAVADYIGRFEHCAIGHMLLAGLPVRGAVTTNYDRLYEIASEAAGDPVSVLPYEPSAAIRSWLLKMHGCVTRPNDIVLTRADFLRYDQRRAALRGVVQAMLLTRHMLFVGFSMTDDNFHRILDDVRRAVRGEGDDSAIVRDESMLATTLSIEDNAFFDELWSSDIHRVGLNCGSKAESARLLEVFLDYLGAASAATTSHLLDERYHALLDPAEVELREALLRMVDALSDNARHTEAWKFIEIWLGRLGKGVDTGDP